MAATIQWQKNCYGCTEAELRDGLARAIALSGPAMIAMSILSDSQEILEGPKGDKDLARQFMNRAKWVIAEHMPRMIHAGWEGRQLYHDENVWSSWKPIEKGDLERWMARQGDRNYEMRKLFIEEKRD